MSANADERIKQLRAQFVADSRPLHNRRSTDRQPQLHTENSPFTTNVIYHMVTPPLQPAISQRNGHAIEWNKSPRMAKWWAVDASGEAHWFCVPNADTGDVPGRGVAG
jgi:hypothetical protein